MAPDYSPMTLGNMRESGVRSLHVWCGNCRCSHQAVLDVERYPDEIPVPSFGPRMMCTRCGFVGADARPNWKEAKPYGVPPPR